MLVFDAARGSGVFHGVDHVYRDSSTRMQAASRAGSSALQKMLSKPNVRVSMQYRLVYPELWNRIKIAWMARNIYSFEANLFRSCSELVGVPVAAGGSRRDATQRIVDELARDLEKLNALFDRCQTIVVLPGNERKYLAGEILTWNVGGPRPQFECAWHIDREVSGGAYSSRIRVDLPSFSSPTRRLMCSCNPPSQAAMFTSHTATNPDRKFFTCAKPKEERCDFWQWSKESPEKTTADANDATAVYVNLSL